MYHSLLIRSPTEGCLGCIHILSVVNHTAVSIHVQVSMWTVSPFSSVRLEVEALLGPGELLPRGLEAQC